MRTLTVVSIFVLVLLVACNTAKDKTEEPKSQTQYLELDLQRRDPQTGKVKTTKEKLIPSKTGIVVVDMWNYTWCMTVGARAEAIVERMNKSLEVARKLGMQVIWSPAGVASMYAGTPQYERALAIPNHPVPKVGEDFHVSFLTPEAGECMCGPGINCLPEAGMDGQIAVMHIAEQDLIIPSDGGRLYSICKEKDITHLIYMGVHANMCIMNRTLGIRRMTVAGLTCILARDITDAATYYHPDNGFTPDDGTAHTIAEIETAIPSINMLEEMKKTSAWDRDRVVEFVRLAPWGKPARPYLFEDAVTVTLTTPLQDNVEIRYTLDGSEPTAASTLYSKPLIVSDTTTMQTAAFDNEKKVTLTSTGYFVKLGPVPPKPDIYMDQIKTIPKPDYSWDPKISQGYEEKHYSWDPKINRSYEGKPLRIRGKDYEKGMGMLAPGNFLCEIKPEYDRFVALAGVDNSLVDLWSNPDSVLGNGALVSWKPTVQFHVYIDGELAAQSPPMHINQVPWRFDVKIPEGSMKINLVVTDEGSRSVLDLADWVDAGFIVKK